MKRILVVRNDKIGDFMLAWPSFAMLKRSMECHVTALVPAYTAPLARLCPWIDEIILDPGVRADKEQQRALLEAADPATLTPDHMAELSVAHRAVVAQLIEHCPDSLLAQLAARGINVITARGPDGTGKAGADELILEFHDPATAWTTALRCQRTESKPARANKAL